MRRRVRFGRLLDFVGQLGLPLLIGLGFGFYASDRGMSLMPGLLKLLSVGLLLSLLLILLGNALKGRLVKEGEGGVLLRRRVVTCMSLALLAVAGRLAVEKAEDPTPLTGLDGGEFEEVFALDARRYAELDRELEGIVARVETLPLLARKSDRVPTAEEEEALLDASAAAFDSIIALDQLRVFYEDWYRFDPSRAQRDRHLRSFLLAFAAELAQYEKGARLTQAVLRNPNAVKYLNAPHPSRELPAQTFSRFQEEFLGSQGQGRILAAQEYRRFLDQAFGGRQEARQLGVDWLWKDIDAHLGVVAGIAPLDRSLLTLNSHLQILQRTLRRVWMPAQQDIAEWMGDTRLRRPGWYLITPEQLAEMDHKLEPGDILLSRKNWYLSNVGLPGFWPHAILYLGEPDKLDAYFDDPAVRGEIARLAGEELSLLEYLVRRWPSRGGRYLQGDAEAPFRVIESISEGVVLNTLEDAAGDYLAALRPRLDKRSKAQAIIEAFSNLGKPYDFEFDFATEHALVCTELVWRSYRRDAGKNGLDLPLRRIAGRRTLPANEIAAIFAREYGRPESQLDFVYYLDAREDEQRAVVADLDAFLRSHERTKWDFRLR